MLHRFESNTRARALVLALFAAAALVLYTHAAFAEPLPPEQALSVVERNANGPETSGIFGRFDKVSFKPYDELSRTTHE